MRKSGRLRSLLKKKLWKWKVSSWLIVALLFLISVGVLAFFLVRREVLDYTVGHTFAVSDPACFVLEVGRHP